MSSTKFDKFRTGEFYYNVSGKDKLQDINFSRMKPTRIALSEKLKELESKNPSKSNFNGNRKKNYLDFYFKKRTETS